MPRRIMRSPFASPPRNSIEPRTKPLRNLDLRWAWTRDAVQTVGRCSKRARRESRRKTGALPPFSCPSPNVPPLARQQPAQRSADPIGSRHRPLAPQDTQEGIFDKGLQRVFSTVTRPSERGECGRPVFPLREAAHRPSLNRRNVRVVFRLDRRHSSYYRACTRAVESDPRGQTEGRGRDSTDRPRGYRWRPCGRQSRRRLSVSSV